MSGLLRPPDGVGNRGGIVQGPGWFGLKDANLHLPYHEALTEAGFTVLIFDYRGFGDSGEGTISTSAAVLDNREPPPWPRRQAARARPLPVLGLGPIATPIEEP